MTIFDVYLGREFHATQKLEYHEIDDLHIHIGQNIQQQQQKKTYDNPIFCKGVPVICIGALTFTFIPKSIHVHLFFPFTRNLAFSFL